MKAWIILPFKSIKEKEEPEIRPLKEITFVLVVKHI